MDEYASGLSMHVNVETQMSYAVS